MKDRRGHGSAQYQAWLGRLAALDDGSPAWPVADANGISETTFRARLRHGWSGQRAATQPLRVQSPSSPWEAVAVACGVSVVAYRARRRAGYTHMQAAEAWSYQGEYPPDDE